jgi:hypothetical protein
MSFMLAVSLISVFFALSFHIKRSVHTFNYEGSSCKQLCFSALTSCDTHTARLAGVLSHTCGTGVICKQNCLYISRDCSFNDVVRPHCIRKEASLKFILKVKI